MSNDKKIKLYKNSERDKPEVRKNYVPQYQIMGIEPEDFATPSNKPTAILQKKSIANIADDSARTRAPKLMQPYAKMVPSPIGRGRGLVPNVGNNMEHTWSSVDGEIVDDISDDFSKVEFDHVMIDNNDILTSESLGYEDNVVITHLEEAINNSVLTEGYSLFLQDEFVSSGSLEEIQEQVKMLVFGEHYLSENTPVAIEDISVFKVEKVKIKVGVFLE